MRDLREGDVIHSDRYDTDIEIRHVIDETDSAFGTVIYTGLGDDGWPYDVIEGVTVRIGGVA